MACCPVQGFQAPVPEKGRPEITQIQDKKLTLTASILPKISKLGGGGGAPQDWGLRCRHYQKRFPGVQRPRTIFGFLLECPTMRKPVHQQLDWGFNIKTAETLQWSRGHWVGVFPTICNFLSTIGKEVSDAGFPLRSVLGIRWASGKKDPVFRGGGAARGTKKRE
ncbi:hypothetical protein GWK47_003454 [Chionoecetes opilio]|uniref:Uncharacterized protein n=1 Tax=Chionoecetes opilio TaxID=41210 RepID=A0A8J4YRY3_CHIOP|nr:hypothetical protein GWK47_003454 [Chionoecetes opilio]